MHVHNQTSVTAQAHIVAPAPAPAHIVAPVTEIVSKWLLYVGLYVIFIIINALSIWRAVIKLNEEITDKKEIAYTMITFGVMFFFISLLLLVYNIIIYKKKLYQKPFIKFIITVIFSIISSLVIFSSDIKKSFSAVNIRGNFLIFCKIKI